MVDNLHIPIEYVENASVPVSGLLITVDCHYGAGNVTRLTARQVAVIDHHQLEISNGQLSEIRPDVGSCATVVWHMLTEEGFSFDGRIELGTALYYRLYSDTNQFSEIYHPLDMQLRDSVPFNKDMISLFRNSNLSLEEMEIAGVAMIQHVYNAEYRYDIVKTRPYDPNILGFISDFVMQVDGVDSCVVYNHQEDGIKFSVRSCLKDVHANELASYLGGEVGSGGGHSEKAGGFLIKSKYEGRTKEFEPKRYFKEKLDAYFSKRQEQILLYK
jgi:phosphoglycolate phosphatase